MGKFGYRIGSYVLGTVVSSVNDVISPVPVVAENCRREAAAEPTPRTAVMRPIVRNLIIVRHLWLFRPYRPYFETLCILSSSVLRTGGRRAGRGPPRK